MADQPKQILSILAQYIKDFSFENVSSIDKRHDNDTQPNIDVQLNIGVANGQQEHSYVVSLFVKIDAKKGSDTLFLLDMTYTGEFLIEGFPNDVMDPLLYIECPRILFPFIRCIVANTVSDGGFPPLYIEPIDFLSMYQQRMMEKEKNQHPEGQA